MANAAWSGRIQRQKSRSQGGKTWLVAIVAFLAGTAAGAAVAVPATLFLRPSSEPQQGPELVAQRGPRIPQRANSPTQKSAPQKPTSAGKPEPAPEPAPPTVKEPAPEPTPPPVKEAVPPAKPEPAPEPAPPAVKEPAPEPAEPTEPTEPTRTGPADPFARPLVKQSDFKYLGGFALPKEACKATTAFCGTGLAFRRVGGKLQFLTGTGRPSGDQIYEVSFPGFGMDFEKSGSKLPRAKVVHEWGNVYQGRQAFDCVAYGLFWDEPTKRLYWSNARYYNANGENQPSLGYVELTDKGAVSHGPWATNSYVQKVRGGCLRLPEYFSKKYANGRPLALGFGGSYCIIAGGSFGPCLCASTAPQKEGEVLSTLTLLNYEAAGKDKAHYCQRDTDYRTEMEIDKNPVGGVGFWTGADYINGACCWIDLPDKHGVLYIGQMGHGRIWYGEPEGGVGDKGINSKRSEPWWYVFNPADLAAVVQRKKQPYAPVPKWWKCEETSAVTPGCCFDPKTRTLYVLSRDGWQDPGDVEAYPVIHGYRVK